MELAVLRFSQNPPSAEISALKDALHQKVLYTDERTINTDDAWIKLARPIIRQLVIEYERELRRAPDLREDLGGA